MKAQSAQTQKVQPAREMGRWSLTAIGVCGIVGSGIYALPTTVAASLGPYSVPAYLLAAVMVLIFGHSMGVLGRRHELSGGPYLYVGAVFGAFWGFQVGWFFALARLTAMAAIANVFVSYFARFFPACGTGMWRAGVIGGCVGVLTAINVAGIRDVARVMNAFALAKILPLVAFVMAGAFFANWARLSFHGAAPPQHTGATLLLLVYAFSGFEFLTVPAEESRRPTEHMPFALMASITGTSLLYLCIQAVTLATIPATGGAAHEDALAYAAQQFGGAGAALAMTLAAMAATSGTIFANLLVTSRLLYAFSRDGIAPAALGALHRRLRTPVLAIVLAGFVGAALAVSGTFTHLAALSAAARLVTYGASCAAVLRLRAPERAAGKMLLPAVGVMMALVMIAQLSPHDLLIAAAAPIIGALIYWTRRKVYIPVSSALGP